MLGFKDYKGNVLDSFAQVMQEQAGEKIGAIKFTRKDRTSVAILYVKVGAVYGIELSTYKPNIVSRLVSSPTLAEEHRDQILEKYGQPHQLNDYSVVEYLLTRHMIPEVEVMRVLREHFLDSFDEVGTWDEVHTEWKPGQEPPAGIISIPSLPWTGLLDRWRRRQNHLNSVLVPEWGIPADKIGDLLVHAEQGEVPADLKPDAMLLYSAVAASPEVLTVEQLATWLGMSRFSTKLGLFELWSRQLVTVSTEGGPTINANPHPPVVEEAPVETAQDIETVLDDEVHEMNTELNESLQVENFTTIEVEPAEVAEELSPELEEEHIMEEPTIEPQEETPVAVTEDPQPAPEPVVETPALEAPQVAEIPAFSSLLGADMSALAQQVRAQYKALADRKNQLASFLEQVSEREAELDVRANELSRQYREAENARLAEKEAATSRLEEIDARLAALQEERWKLQDTVTNLSQESPGAVEQEQLDAEAVTLTEQRQSTEEQLKETDEAVRSLQELFRL